MSQSEKTEAIIEEWADDDNNVKLLTHARDLARKLDEIALWGRLHSNEDVADAIRAMVEDE